MIQTFRGSFGSDCCSSLSLSESGGTRNEERRKDMVCKTKFGASIAQLRATSYLAVVPCRNEFEAPK
jgi:hypothetical protein